jgi:hypothetical protein
MYTAQTRTVALSSHVRFVLLYRRYEKLNNFETPTIIKEHGILFLIYVTFSVSPLNERMINELERKRLWPNLRHYPDLCREVFRKPTNKPCDMQAPSQDLNPGPC